MIEFEGWERKGVFGEDDCGLRGAAFGEDNINSGGGGDGGRGLREAFGFGWLSGAEGVWKRTFGGGAEGWGKAALGNIMICRRTKNAHFQMKMIVHPWLVPTNQELKIPFFLTFRSVQTLSKPKVVDGIKMELFRATTIIRKTIFEGGLVAVDDGGRSGSGTAVGANDAPFIDFETTSHYDYDHIGCTYFLQILPHLANVDVTTEATAEEHNIIVDNPSTTFKEKVKPVSSGKWKNYLFEGFNILDEAPKKLTNLINNYSECIADRLLKHHACRYYQQQLEVFGNEECLINTIKGFSIPAGLPSHLVDEVYILINCAYRDKMDNPFDVQYVEGIAQQTIDSLDCGPFVAAYVEYLSDVLQVPNDGLYVGLLRKRYAALLWKYEEAKAQKPSIAPDEEHLIHID
ncbi:hypothetical protein FXO38_01223 [Capsicum annuum]|nr:hypothetical protein FXO37_24187 [Capsicum annuum]KAF3682583.1 hypothetical protein FXO38_01223 [Capsicum annuum]